jgi:hypothetical protein
MIKPSKFEANKLLLTGCATVALATAAFVTAPAAQAQFYFRPFAYTFHRPMEEPAPYASRRGVARILSREGYRLVGPLGSRGDQIVAMGVDARGRRVRFIVDPYEGQVLHSRPIGRARFDEGPREYGARQQPYGALDEDDYEPQEPRVIEGVDGERSPNARPGAAPRSVNATPQNQTAARPPGIESAAPRVTPSEAAPPAPMQEAVAPATPSKNARPAAPARDRRAVRHGGGSKRAITPPSAEKTPAQANANPAAAPSTPSPAKAQPAKPAAPANAAPATSSATNPAPAIQATPSSPAEQSAPVAAQSSPAKAPAHASAPATQKEPAKTDAPTATQAVPSQAAAPPAKPANVAQPATAPAAGASASDAKAPPASPPASGPNSKGG